MNIFGLHIVTQTGYQQIKEDAYNAALKTVIDLLCNSDKVYTQPVSIFSGGAPVSVTNCTFLSTPGSLALSIAEGLATYPPREDGGDNGDENDESDE